MHSQNLPATGEVAENDTTPHGFCTHDITHFRSKSSLSCLIGEREQANLVVTMADFYVYLHLFLSDDAATDTVMLYVILN